MSRNNSRKTNGIEKIEDRLLRMIESSKLPPWRQPWIYTGADVAFQGKAYTGVNAIVLAMTRAMKGYGSRVWLTKARIEELNGRKWDEASRRWVKDPDYRDKPLVHIRKGAEGVPLIRHYDVVRVNPRTGEPYLDENGEEIRTTGTKRWYVFNADDVVNFDPTPFEPDSPSGTGVSVDSCRKFEELIYGLYPNPPEITHDGRQAQYSPAADCVVLPSTTCFLTVEEYASTLAHELAHSTGHEARLNRDLSGEEGTPSYAREELVAEFASAIILSRFGLTTEHVTENQAAYIKEWSSVLKGNPGMLMGAIRDANMAVNLILGEGAPGKQTQAG